MSNVKVYGQIPVAYKDEVSAVCKNVADETASSISHLLSWVADGIESGRTPSNDAVIVLRGLVKVLDETKWGDYFIIVEGSAAPPSRQ